MRKHIRRSVFVTMLVAGSAMLSSSAAAQQEMQQVPQQLQPPAGEGYRSGSTRWAIKSIPAKETLRNSRGR